MVRIWTQGLCPQSWALEPLDQGALLRFHYDKMFDFLISQDDDDDDSIVISLDDKKFSMLRENGVKFVGHYDADEQRKLREEEAEFESRSVPETLIRTLLDNSCLILIMKDGRIFIHWPQSCQMSDF